jgi:uncharacterized membrane protein
MTNARDDLAGLTRRQRATAGTHLLVSLAVGLVVGVALLPASTVRIALLAGWTTAGTVFLVWTWTSLWPLDGRDTERLAVREDSSRLVRDIVLLGVAVVSLLTVALVIFRAHHGGVVSTLLGVACITASWAVLHTVLALRYARLYYAHPVGGIDFKQDQAPAYRDFAYVAFTVGMTFQVADTDLGHPTIRSTVLGHALVSFVFATFIIAVTINLVAGLGA